VVRDFCGHGLGRVFHDAPTILHYVEPSYDVPLKAGMLFTVEPMINLGRPHVKVLGDGWTAVTRDRSLSAQFEHTVGVTDTGSRFLRSPPKATTSRPTAEPRRARRQDGPSAASCGKMEPMSKADPDEPHYHGHRDRLRARFAEAGGDALPDYELLELVLFRAIPRRDVKPIAKELIRRFGSFAEVLAAPPGRLIEVEGIGESVVTDLKVTEAARAAWPRARSRSGRCCRPGRRCSITAAPPWRLPRRNSSGCCSSTSATR
jgi:hypothetical protein